MSNLKVSVVIVVPYRRGSVRQLLGVFLGCRDGSKGVSCSTGAELSNLSLSLSLLKFI